MERWINNTWIITLIYRSSPLRTSQAHYCQVVRFHSGTDLRECSKFQQPPCSNRSLGRRSKTSHLVRGCVLEIRHHSTIFNRKGSTDALLNTYTCPSNKTHFMNESNCWHAINLVDHPWVALPEAIGRAWVVKDIKGGACEIPENPDGEFQLPVYRRVYSDPGVGQYTECSVFHPEPI